MPAPARARLFAISLLLSLLTPAIPARAEAAPVFEPVSFAEGAADLHAEPGAPGAWLVAAEAGLLRVAGGETQRLAAGRFERLDARGGVQLGGESLVLVSAIDVDAGAVRLVAYDPATAAVAARAAATALLTVMVSR